MSRSTRLRRAASASPRDRRAAESPRPRGGRGDARRRPPPIAEAADDRRGRPRLEEGRDEHRMPRPSRNPSPEPEPAEPKLDDDEPAPELVWYVLKVQSSREDTIRDALQRRVKIQGLQRFFGKIVVPDREDHRDPQQQETDRRAEDLSRLHHGPDGAQREDLVPGPGDARRGRLRRGPRHADQDDRRRSQPDAAPGRGEDRPPRPPRSASTSSAAIGSRSRTVRSRTSRGPSRRSSRDAAWSR